MPECPSLKAANDSRKRAWRELQRLRRILEAAKIPLSPLSKPPDFTVEGAAISSALAWILLNQADLTNLLQRSLTDLICAVEHQQARRRYPGARRVMEHLLTTPHLPASLMEELRKLADFQPRDLDRIIKEVAGQLHALPQPDNTADDLPPLVP